MIVPESLGAIVLGNIQRKRSHHEVGIWVVGVGLAELNVNVPGQ
jgi:hypothetical protein